MEIWFVKSQHRSTLSFSGDVFCEVIRNKLRIAVGMKFGEDYKNVKRLSSYENLGGRGGGNGIEICENTRSQG